MQAKLNDESGYALLKILNGDKIYDELLQA